MALEAWYDTAALKAEWETKLAGQAAVLTMDDVLREESLRKLAFSATEQANGSQLEKAQAHYSQQVLDKILPILEQAEGVGKVPNGSPEEQMAIAEESIRRKTRQLATRWIGSANRKTDYSAAMLMLEFCRTHDIEVWPAVSKEQAQHAKEAAESELKKVASNFKEETFKNDPEFSEGYESHTVELNRKQLTVTFNFLLHGLSANAAKGNWPKFFDLCRSMTEPSDSLVFQYAASRTLQAFGAEVGIDLAPKSRQSARPV